MCVEREDRHDFCRDSACFANRAPSNFLGRRPLILSNYSSNTGLVSVGDACNTLSHAHLHSQRTAESVRGAEREPCCSVQPPSGRNQRGPRRCRQQ